MILGLIGEYAEEIATFTKQLLEHGHYVYPPVWQGRWHFNADGTSTVTETHGILNLERIDGVVLLPSWATRAESRWELNKALDMGKPVYVVRSWNDNPPIRRIS